MRLAIGMGLTLGAGDLWAQTQAPDPQTAAEASRIAQERKIQQLQDKLEEIQKELLELKKANLAPTEPHPTTTAKATAPPSSHS